MREGAWSISFSFMEGGCGGAGGGGGGFGRAVGETKR